MMSNSHSTLVSTKIDWFSIQLGNLNTRSCHKLLVYDSHKSTMPENFTKSCSTCSPYMPR
ncbi:hypothetical protein Hanom_Chr16g01428881 [Helianthus anomalus]